MSKLFPFFCAGTLLVLCALSGCNPRSDIEQTPTETPTGDNRPTLMSCFEKAAEAAKAEDWGAVRDAYRSGMELASNVPGLVLATAEAEARLGDHEAAAELLEHFAALGGTTELAQREGFADALTLEEFQELAARLSPTSRPMSPAEVIHRIADIHFWPEGIALDDSTGDLYLGSIEHRAFFRFSNDGSFEEVPITSDEGMLEILGVWVDSDRRALWAATGLGEYEEPLTGQPRSNELLHIDLDSNRIVRRHTVPDDELRLLNDVVVGPDGTAWATETLRNELFRVAPGGDLELVRRFDELIYLNGITISADGSTLYLGHYQGLTALDLATNAVHTVDGEAMALGMVDGLNWVDNTLILVQNSPRVNNRIVRVTLDDTGYSAVRLEALPSGVPEGLIPYTCASQTDSVFFVAGSPFEVKDRDGTPTAPAILKISLD